MVLVAVGEHDRLDVIEPVKDRGKVRQDQINAGIVTVLVGFAPLRPAEFVVIRISQKTAEAAV